MKNLALEYLIEDFLEKVDKATAMLEKKFGDRFILRLWGTKKIPQRGTVSGNVTYELHGVGCRVYLPEACIDFDYGPDGRIDGFDSWRLYIYANEFPERHPQYTELEIVERDLDEYITAGKVKRMHSGMSNLYFKDELLW
ncbi:hypothetical protein BI292_27595 [Pseudomonas sp. 43NM1]|uniref:DUF6896 domain-containing protein n=1 Tax=Pseudomonas sp. 43NM1 TaxID=1904755 RepID=UPI000C32F66B|nr:hypothetical protein [Pseudomonas sp. 43NM1]PKH28886.1 hypothetical protein BI292_27595 [Pseudomonas sp. 43NM1]